MNVIDQVFDFVEGQDGAVEITFDISTLKTALSGEGGSRFANALAAALPPCAGGQAPVPQGSTLVRCIAPDSSVNAAAQQIVQALPAVLEDMPSRLMLNNLVNLRSEWGLADWFRVSNLRIGLDAAILIVILSAVAAGVVGAYLGGDDLRGRLLWLATSLWVPASLFVMLGLTLATPLIDGPLRDGLIAARWNGIQYSDAFREAITDLVMWLAQQTTAGVLLTGVVSALVALGLFGWSRSLGAGDRQGSKRVQVPVRNS
jgi:hypothetical protein